MNSRLLMVGLFGFTGIHKFMDKEYGKGILYLCTFGLLGFGWITDFIRELRDTSKRKTFIKGNSLMDRETKKMIKGGILTNIYAENLLLSENEICHYADTAYTFKDKSVATGYKGSGAGVSIRLAKNLSFRTGSSDKKAIRENQRTIYPGVMYITSNRIIYNSTQDAIDTTFNKITSITELKEGIILQIGNKSYTIVLKTPELFMKVFNMIRNE